MFVNNCKHQKIWQHTNVKFQELISEKQHFGLKVEFKNLHENTSSLKNNFGYLEKGITDRSYNKIKKSGAC